MLSQFCCFQLFTFFICTTLFYKLIVHCDPSAPDLIILTDMEPDDRIALDMVANRPELSKRLLFVGTTLLNTQLKAELAKRQLRYSGLNVPVYAGTGGPPSSYPNNVETAKAALKFWHEEGNGILSEEELKRFKGVIESEENDPIFDKTIVEIGPIEDIWSVIIEGLPESDAPKQTERYYKEDYDVVIKLLDLMDIATPPKFVYRIPRGNDQNMEQKSQQQEEVKPRKLKVFFPTGMVTPTLLKKWENKAYSIRRKSDYTNLGIYSTLNARNFEKAKEHFKADDGNKATFNHANEKFGDVNNEIEAEPSEPSENKSDYAREQSMDIQHTYDASKKQETKQATPSLDDIDMRMIIGFLNFEEKERSIRITGLPEYMIAVIDDDGNEKLQPPSFASESYKADLKAVMEILFEISVEVSPVTVRRIGEQVDDRRRRYLQVVFRNKTTAQTVLRSWKKFQGFRPEWQGLMIRGFGNNHPPEENKIETKEQLSDMLGFLQDSPFLAVNQLTVSKDNKGKQQNALTGTANVSNNVNELQLALIKALNKAKENSNSLEIVLMTAPIDLVKVLHIDPDLVKAIRRVHLMGGWVELHKNYERHYGKERKTNEPPPPTIWGNYNLNMAPESSRRLFAMASEKGLPLRLYTYRHIWEVFEGGVNRNKFDTAINKIKESLSPVMRDFRTAAKSWDEHAMRVMPYLARFISKYAGEQFSPADPILETKGIVRGCGRRGGDEGRGGGRGRGGGAGHGESGRYDGGREHRGGGRRDNSRGYGGGYGRGAGIIQRGPVDPRTSFYNGPGSSNRRQPSETIRNGGMQNFIAKEFKLDNDQFPAIGTVQKNMKNGRKW